MMELSPFYYYKSLKNKIVHIINERGARQMNKNDIKKEIEEYVRKNMGDRLYDFKCSHDIGAHAFMKAFSDLTFYALHKKMVSYEEVNSFEEAATEITFELTDICYDEWKRRREKLSGSFS